VLRVFEFFLVHGCGETSFEPLVSESLLASKALRQIDPLGIRSLAALHESGT